MTKLEPFAEKHIKTQLAKTNGCGGGIGGSSRQTHWWRPILLKHASMQHGHHIKKEKYNAIRAAHKQTSSSSYTTEQYLNESGKQHIAKLTSIKSKQPSSNNQRHL